MMDQHPQVRFTMENIYDNSPTLNYQDLAIPMCYVRLELVEVIHQGNPQRCAAFKSVHP